jgi:HPt (histidine-containing phosphotransfer) domain-containing protein
MPDPIPDASQIQHVSYDESSPLMDREHIDMLLMGGEDSVEEDNALTRELFLLFSNESEAKLETLTDICASGDLRQLRNAVHFIAGSAGNLGLCRLLAFYRAIERAIDEGDLTDISECEPAIRREFEIGRDAFRSEFNL